MSRVVKIGNAQGRIAVYLDEADAIDMAEHYGRNDGFSTELMEAVEQAYPKDEREWPVPEFALNWPVFRNYR